MHQKAPLKIQNFRDSIHSNFPKNGGSLGPPSALVCRNIYIRHCA